MWSGAIMQIPRAGIKFSTPLEFNAIRERDCSESFVYW